MRYTLDTFYHSKEWVTLTHILRMERLDADGNLICSHCGKPIVNQYDAIAHHTVFLTEDNVNDASISLNPDLIQIVHHKCHNHIHNKLGYIRPEIFLVYGSPLSGKSTYVSSVMNIGDLIVDMDRIWDSVSCAGYTKPPVLNSVVFGIRDYLLDSVRIHRGRWNNAYVVGGYPLISERERVCRTLGAREVYIESTKEECLERLSQLSDKSDGRDVQLWEGYINTWWERYKPSPLS